MTKNIKVLDCTLRDGGLGLEDAFKNDISKLILTTQDKSMVADCLVKSNADIIELGSVEISGIDNTGFAIYDSIEAISQQIPSNLQDNQMAAALYRGPDTPIENIPIWHKGLCDVVRVIIRYSELQKSLDFCDALAAKGYKVFIQPMLTMRYTNDELQLIIRESNKMKAYAVYFVDSYGYMQDKDIARLFNVLDSGLDKKIYIGFHAHNNMNLAFSNVQYLLNIETERGIIIDSCIMGMGQGAGNLQTEIVADYLNEKFNKTYNYAAILDACETIEKYSHDTLWGYSVCDSFS